MNRFKIGLNVSYEKTLSYILSIENLKWLKIYKSQVKLKFQKIVKMDGTPVGLMNLEHVGATKTRYAVGLEAKKVKQSVIGGN